MKPDWLREGAHVKRLPGGRSCVVLKLDDARAKALVKDMGHAIWVNYSTLATKWGV